MQDLINRARFSDTLGLAAAFADSHSVDYEFESDEMFFYLLVCRCFNYPLYTDLPYRMLLPRGLNNVWVACRAAGIDPDAFYCVRMQRDMQRLGEAAGIAAAHCASHHADSRNTDLSGLQQALTATGALGGRERIELEKAQQKSLQVTGVLQSDQEYLSTEAADDADAWLQQLDTGKSGIHLWKLYRLAAVSDAVAERLVSADPHVSFYAATVLAMQGDARAESRLLQAVKTREAGISIGEEGNKGPFSQVIDIPFWLQAAALLRVCGTEQCIAELAALARESWPFNVSTLIALTCERLAQKVSDPEPLLAIQRTLLSQLDAKKAQLPTTRSLYKALQGEKIDEKARTWGVDTTQDHFWQFHLILARTERQLGKPLNETARAYLKDSRAYVRKAFESLA